MKIDIVIPARNPDPGFAERIHAIARMHETAEIGAIIVVDDGSERPFSPSLAGIASAVPLRFVRLEGSGNRSKARNAGARTGNSTHVLFVDADCIPADPTLLSALASACGREGVIAAGGPVRGIGEGFWHRYQACAAVARLRSASPTAITSANLLVVRAAFDTVGGFDERYTAYGFEDRDLVLRLAERGTTLFVPEAVMEHRDYLSMEGVSRKMFEAGRGTSARFRDRHPQAYAALGYAAIDVSLQPWLRPLATALAPLAMRLAPWMDRMIRRNALPFWIGRHVVKLITAASFLYGTSQRNSAA